MQKHLFIVIGLFAILVGVGELHGERPRPSVGGPVLYIVNNTRSKIYAREIPTQDYGRKCPIVYITPAQFDPLNPRTSESHDFYANQWFGRLGQGGSNKIKLASNDPSDPNRWDNPLELEMKPDGITGESFRPNEDRDVANKKDKTLEIFYKVGWNGNGWKIILDEREIGIGKNTQ